MLWALRVAAGLVICAPLSAQTITPGQIEDWETQIANDLSRLEPQRGSALQQLAVDGELRVRSFPTDTVPIGHIRLVAPKSQSTRGASLLRSALDEFSSFTEWDTTYTMVFNDADQPEGTFPWVAYGLEGVTRSVMAQWNSTPKSLKSDFVNQIGMTLTQSASPTLRSWIASTPITPARRPDRAFRALSLAPYGMARKCLEEIDVESCKTAMGLASAAQPDQWQTYFTAEELASILSRRGGFLGSGSVERIQARNECFAGDATSCAELLKDRSPTSLLPIPVTVRFDLVQFAVLMGGAGSIDRLLQTRPADNVATILEATAGIPLDQLISEWLVDLKSRPSSQARIPLGMSIRGIAWLALFVGLAWRNAKWR